MDEQNTEVPGPSQSSQVGEEIGQQPSDESRESLRQAGRFVSSRQLVTKEPCFVCQANFGPRQLRGMGDSNLEKLRIAATTLRDTYHPEMPADATLNDKLCVNCHQLAWKIADEQENQTGLLLPVVLSGTRSCIICKSKKEVTQLSLKARLKAYVDINAYIIKSSRCCLSHLREDGMIIPAFYSNIKSIKRRIFMSPDEVVAWFEGLREMVHETIAQYFEDEDHFTDPEFKTFTGFTKAHVEDLYKHCIPLPEEGNKKASKKDLIMFLVKLRQGLSDDFLKILFRVSSRQLVSMKISTVTHMLREHFMPKNLGLDSLKHMTREEFIEKHCSVFANKLYNDNFATAGEKKAIIIIDGTYIYVPKAENYKVLRQSFSVHKGRHLIKPVLVVAPDGYILDVHGPYFADAKNNDAELLKDHLRESNSLKFWLKPGDIVLVDRGYRDCLPVLDSLGIQSKMPAFLAKGMKQHTTEEANKSRLVTKSRWVVETRNGHIKSVFKIFRDAVPAAQVLHVGDYFRIACALINAYYDKIDMVGATEEMADRIIAQAAKPNALKERIERENLQKAAANDPWWDLNAARFLPGFPVLTLDYLRDLTLGVYQVKQAKSYTHDKVEHDSEYVIQVKLSKPGILRARIWSRYRNETKYNTWIEYKERDLEDLNEGDLIKGWYCTCKNGSRTLGCCAHVASVLWYLGYARHLPFTPFPRTSVLHEIQDAAHRTMPQIVE